MVAAAIEWTAEEVMYDRHDGMLRHRGRIINVHYMHVKQTRIDTGITVTFKVYRTYIHMWNSPEDVVTLYGASDVFDGFEDAQAYIDHAIELA